MAFFAAVQENRQIYSTKLSDTLHLIAFICLVDDEPLSSAAIAKSIQMNPAYVRQLMPLLKKAGLLSNTQGQANPVLTRTPEEITLLDVYRAVEGEKPLLHLDTHTNSDCGVGINIQLVISDFYDEVQTVAAQKMKEITIQDILARHELRMRQYAGAIDIIPLPSRD